MKIKISFCAFKNSLFLFLLPVFFVLHGYVDFFHALFLGNVIKLLVEYLIFTGILLTILFFLIKSWRKAAVVTFFILSYNLFFGGLHDTAKSFIGNNFFTSYSLILPLTIMLFIFIFFLVKKTNSTFSRLIQYLSTLLTILIIIDLVQLSVKFYRQNEHSKDLYNSISIKCDTCLKPDIYFIISDAYAGNKELKEVLGFDNSLFENELQKRGFHIVQNSRSNYNSTPFSIASTVNMEYLNNITKEHENSSDIKLCYEKINNNKLVHFFRKSGYAIKNLSIFNFGNIETLSNNLTLFPTKAKLINNQTFLFRVWKDLGYHLITDLHLEFLMRNLAFNVLKYNKKIYNLTTEETKKRIHQPRFIYVHLMMPHHPYYYNKNGDLYPLEKIMNWDEYNQEDYINYLQYSNNRFIELIDQILTNSKRKAIIVFMGDHGFREFKNPIEERYYFMNLNAIYLPSQQYTSFYEGMSNVNQFRVLLNTQFLQSFPLLQDSSIFIH